MIRNMRDEKIQGKPLFDTNIKPVLPIDKNKGFGGVDEPFKVFFWLNNCSFKEMKEGEEEDPPMSPDISDNSDEEYFSDDESGMDAQFSIELQD